MTRFKKGLIMRSLPVLDLLLGIGFAYISPEITNCIAPLFGWQQGDSEFGQYSLILAGIALCGIPFILHSAGFYSRSNMQRVSSALRQLLTFITYYLCAWGIYRCIETTSLHGSHITLVNIIGIPLCLFLRFLSLRLIKLHMRRGMRQIILAGHEDDIERTWNELPEHWRKNLHIAGYSITGQSTEAELQEIIMKNSVSHLVVCGGLSCYKENEIAIQLCEAQGIDIYVALNGYHQVNLKAEINILSSGSRLLVLKSTPDYSWPRIIKSILDRIIAFLMLLGSSPLWIVAAIGIKLSDPKGPIFFKQRRSGIYGKPFTMWKFRSMYVDAEARLEEVKAKYGNIMTGPNFKLDNDPRAFKFGLFLRKYSIDELPQILNILTGDMSVVGPRPLAVYETDNFPKVEHRRRLSVKPGLTCFWQLEYKQDAGDFNQMIAKDLKYIDNWSLWLDFVLFMRTIPAVLFGRKEN